ncbi:hypothetical protein [Flavobacterium sp. N1736]|uniref:hypothetical protein n=1 Tax=Flavobacterium sp. N1736 TaxID=2986823 RepID=UPI002225A2EA|nr:hypothetical protein [Flavobacterium sp. N1736]
MKKSIKYISIIVLIGIVYYLVSVSVHNSGQFINYYFYPSSSISESKEKNIFSNKISKENIQITGSKQINQKIEELEFWLDKAITKKNFGMSGILSYDIVDDNSRTLRIAYKNTKKTYSTAYDDIIWFKLENGQIENPITTTGRFYKLGTKARIHFYDNDKKNEIGTVIIEIK